MPTLCPRLLLTFSLTSFILAPTRIAQPQDAPLPPKEPPAKKRPATKPASRSQTAPRLVKPDSYWRRNLPWISYQVTRHKATENPYSGFFWNHHEDGVYTCFCCGSFLFDSTTKFESGTGWPSFWKPFQTTRIKTKPDTALGVIRTEVMCRACDAHLGHVFPDGPPPTGLRYCINSASLDFLDRAAARVKFEAQESPEKSQSPVATAEADPGSAPNPSDNQPGQDSRAQASPAPKPPPPPSQPRN